MEIGERFRELFKTHNSSVRELCLIHGINYNSFNDMLNGRKEPGMKTLSFTIKVFPEVNLNWLIKENGEMFINEFIV